MNLAENQGEGEEFTCERQENDRCGGGGIGLAETEREIKGKSQRGKVFGGDKMTTKINVKVRKICGSSKTILISVW